MFIVIVCSVIRDNHLFFEFFILYFISISSLLYNAISCFEHCGASTQTYVALGTCRGVWRAMFISLLYCWFFLFHVMFLCVLFLLCVLCSCLYDFFTATNWFLLVFNFAIEMQFLGVSTCQNSLYLTLALYYVYDCNVLFYSLDTSPGHCLCISQICNLKFSAELNGG